jgi:NADH dehydrogenase/NADH:ubiquinone oxidoreductase subunit G
MQPFVTLTVDGARLKARKGTSVLDAAIEYGICIPHLCHVPGLTDIGACRLCIVELVRGDRATITASCTLMVEDGMVVRANSERVQRLRRNVAELLVAQAPNSRAVQDIAVRCGVKNVRYPFRNGDCILCGRCARVCKEFWGAEAIGFIGRGDQRRIEGPFGRSHEFCKLCGSCIILCPMTQPPCEGPMPPDQLALCGRCESKVPEEEALDGSCTFCELGENFQCSRHPGW